MKKTFSLCLAVALMLSLCIPAFAVHDFSMPYDEYIAMPSSHINMNRRSRPKNVVSYEFAKFSKEEIEQHAENICENAVFTVENKIGHPSFYIQINIEDDLYIFNKDVLAAATCKLYDTQEEFFRAYGKNLPKTCERMTPKHIAGEIYCHLVIYKMFYHLSAIGIKFFYNASRIIDLNMDERIMPEFIISINGDIIL